MRRGSYWPTWGELESEGLRKTTAIAEPGSSETAAPFQAFHFTHFLTPTPFLFFWPSPNCFVSNSFIVTHSHVIETHPFEVQSVVFSVSTGLCTITTVSLRNISSPQKGPGPALTQPLRSVCLSGCACSGRFLPLSGSVPSAGISKAVLRCSPHQPSFHSVADRVHVGPEHILLVQDAGCFPLVPLVTGKLPAECTLFPSGACTSSIPTCCVCPPAFLSCSLVCPSHYHCQQGLPCGTCRVPGSCLSSTAAWPRGF